MVLWELAKFIPGGPDEYDVWRPWIETQGAIGLIHVGAKRTVLSVELTSVGASATIDTRQLSDPMRAAIEALPQGPFRLASILEPDCQAHGDDDTETVDDVRCLQRVLRDIKAIAHLRPSLMHTIDTLLEPLRDKLDLHDD